MGLETFTGRFLLFAATHSLLAAPAVKELIISKMGTTGRFYRLGYNVLSLLLFGWVMLSWPFSPVLYFLPGGWSLVFYLVQGILLVAIFRCIRQTGMADFLGFTQLRETPAPQLATTGFYGLVRHPLYSLTILFFFLNPVMTEKWLALSALATIYFIIGAVLEERRLLRQFGASYQCYRQAVPMFIPRLQSPKSKKDKNLA